MADTPSPVFINLISDDSDGSDDAAADVDMEQSSESGGPPDGSDSDGSMVIPRVPSPQGSEDDETDAESETGDTGAPPHRAPEIRFQIDVPAGPLSVPRIERPTYTMDHSQFSPAFHLSLPLPEAFSRAGLQNSEHAHQWLNHIRDNTAPMPPYADNLSGMDAAVFLQLTVNLQREATILPMLEELLTETESSILELERLEYLVARVANGPVMRAAAEAQGVTLQIPPWLRDRASTPPPLLVRSGGALNTNTSGNQHDATESGSERDIASGQSAASPGPAASQAKASSSKSGGGAKRGHRSVSRAVVHPVTFPCASGILEEPLGSSEHERPQTFTRTARTQHAVVRQNAATGPSGSSGRGNAQAGPSNSRGRPQPGSSSSAGQRTGVSSAAVRRRHHSTSSDEADEVRPLKKKRR